MHPEGGDSDDSEPYEYNLDSSPRLIISTSLFLSSPHYFLIRAISETQITLNLHYNAMF